MVDGMPAYRFSLPGDGDMEAWFFEGGIPAGYTFRDPVRKAQVEVRLRTATAPDKLDAVPAWLRARFQKPTSLLVVSDGKLDQGWSPGPAFEWSNAEAVDGLFRRPQ
jgi:hypothetical protein